MGGGSWENRKSCLDGQPACNDPSADADGEPYEGMSKGVGVGMVSACACRDLLDLTVRDQVTFPFASYAHR